MTHAAAIKSFVIETLGCRCPESVFEQIDYDDTSTIPGLETPFKRWLIGHRLQSTSWSVMTPPRSRVLFRYWSKRAKRNAMIRGTTAYAWSSPPTSPSPFNTKQTGCFQVWATWTRKCTFMSSPEAEVWIVSDRPYLRAPVLDALLSAKCR
jgi:hypothetical protein